MNLLLETSDAGESFSGSGTISHGKPLYAGSSQTDTNKTCLLRSNYKLETTNFGESEQLSRSRNVGHSSVDKDLLSGDILIDTDKSDRSGGGTKSLITSPGAKKETSLLGNLNPLQVGSMRTEMGNLGCEKRYTGLLQGDQVFERVSLELMELSSSPKHGKKRPVMEKKLSIEEIGMESDQEEIEIPYKRYKEMVSSQDSDATIDYHLSQKSDSQDIVCLDDKPIDGLNKREYEVAEVLSSLKGESKTEPELIDLTEDEDEEFDDGEHSGDNRSPNLFGLKYDTENSEAKVVNSENKKRQRKCALKRSSSQNEENEIIVLDDSQSLK